MSYLRHVVHVSVPRPLLHCHRKHFRGNGLGGGGRTPKAAALARSSDRHRHSLDRPTALCLRHRRRRQRRPRRTDGAAPLLLPLFYPPLPPFTIARSSDRSLPLSQALCPLYAPASHCQSAESTSGAGAACTHGARLPPSFVRWLACGGDLLARFIEAWAK